MSQARFLAMAVIYVPLVVGVFAGCGEASLQTGASSETKPLQSNATVSLRDSSSTEARAGTAAVGLRHSTEDEATLCAPEAALESETVSATQTGSAEVSGAEVETCGKTSAQADAR